MKRFSRKTAESAGHTQENYLVSVSDLMAGLVFVFLVMLMSFALRFQEAEKKTTTEISRLQEADESRRRVLEALQTSLKEQGVQVEVDKDNGILHLPESLLFDMGQAELRPGGVKAMATLARGLAGALPKVENALEAVLIEGHTDNSPIKSAYADKVGTYRDNWDLSFQRSKQTFLTMLSLRPDLKRFKNSHQSPLLGMSAYGDTRPIADNRTESGKRKNRRIDIRLIIEPPKSH